MTSVAPRVKMFALYMGSAALVLNLRVLPDIGGPASQNLLFFYMGSAALRAKTYVFCMGSAPPRVNTYVLCSISRPARQQLRVLCGIGDPCVKACAFYVVSAAPRASAPDCRQTTRCTHVHTMQCVFHQFSRKPATRNSRISSGA